MSRATPISQATIARHRRSTPFPVTLPVWTPIASPTVAPTNRA
ncbi:MAG: hypothetical protein U0528_06750 [Anaerolineae bacterium]